MPNYFRKKLRPIFSFLNKTNPKLKTRSKKPLFLTTTLNRMSSKTDKHAQMREAFTLFDTDKDGKISPSELGVLMRSLGGNPTQSQLKSIVAEEKLTGPFGFDRFVELMGKHLSTEPVDEKLKHAFKVLDRENCGFVNVKDLKHVLTSIGEKLEADEFDEWVREVNVGADGKIKYEDFVNRMLAR